MHQGMKKCLPRFEAFMEAINVLAVAIPDWLHFPPLHAVSGAGLDIGVVLLIALANSVVTVVTRL
jgi:hypothetical protein